jgi:integrase
MSLKKRGPSGYFYWHEWIDGTEYRESTKTTDRNKAKEYRQDRITEIKTGKGGKLSRQHFEAAIDAYVESRKLHVEPKTYQSDKDRAKPLKDYFKQTPLRRITADMIRDYQIQRKAAMKTVKTDEGDRQEPLSNRTVNIEVGLLRRVLKRNKLWTRLADSIDNLPEGSHVGRALENSQREKLIQTAATKNAWQAAYCAAVLALNTTMRSAEIKGLQWSRVDVFNQTLLVSRKTTKTNAGERLIPLNRDAVWALSRMLDRAKTIAQENELGEIKPEHYVFCACENYEFDLTKPMKSWRSAWRSLTEKAGLKGLRFHDLRHNAITVLAESGASDQTIMSLAGHVSRKMLDHYSHIRLDAKRKAVEALQTRPQPALTVQADSTDESAAQAAPVVN